MLPSYLARLPLRSTVSRSAHHSQAIESRQIITVSRLLLFTMLHDALLMVAAFACLGAGMLLFILGTAPADHPAVGWIARIAPVGRRRVPLLAFALGGLMLAGAVALVAWMARGISLD